MKALLTLFLIAAGAGYAFHDQLQTWLHLSRTGNQEVYYLRAARQTTNPDGTVVRWAPGQPLRTTTQAAAAEGAVALTDGTNVLQVPKNVLTRDAGEAATLRQTNLVSENTARIQAAQETDRQAHDGSMAGAQSSYPYNAGTVATASAPVYYYPVYVAPAATPNPVVHNRLVITNHTGVTVVAPPRPQHHDPAPRSVPRPGPTPSR